MSEDEQSQYSAVVVIGGDGLLFEVVNGVSDRVLLPQFSSSTPFNDASHALNYVRSESPSQLLPQDTTDQLQRVYCSINIAPIPGGTGWSTICGSYCSYLSSLHSRKAMDW